MYVCMYIYIYNTHTGTYINNTQIKSIAPIVFGLKAARTSSNIHPFQYSFDMAKLGALNVEGIDIDEGG